MEKEKVTEELLRDAFLKLSDELIEEWENLPDIKHEPSKKFNKKMDKLLKKFKKKDTLKFVFDIAKIAAAILIVIGGILYGNTLEARANPYTWFRKMEVTLNNASMYVYDEESGNYYLNIYEPTYVPDGYIEEYRSVNEIGISIRYKNENGENITWKQRLISNTTIIGEDNEYDGKIETEYIGENINMHVYGNGCKSVYYESVNNVFHLNADNISVEDMYKMVESMEKIN